MSELTEAELVAEAIAQRDALIINQYGPGSVVMERCALCGRMSFLCCQTAEHNSVTMQEVSPSSCIRCNEVRQRAPEIFNWVMGVAQQIRVKAAAISAEHA